MSLWCSKWNWLNLKFKMTVRPPFKRIHAIWHTRMRSFFQKIPRDTPGLLLKHLKSLQLFAAAAQSRTNTLQSHKPPSLWQPQRWAWHPHKSLPQRGRGSVIKLEMACVNHFKAVIQLSCPWRCTRRRKSTRVVLLSAATSVLFIADVQSH